MRQATQRPGLFAELKTLGAVQYNLLLPETKAIPTVLKSNEKILGLVYGRYKQEKKGLVSRGVLLATDRRLILLNKKFMFKQSEEIGYQVISGVDYSRIAFASTVTLHTRLGDIHIRTFNPRCAKIFVAAIEHMIFPA